MSHRLSSDRLRPVDEHLFELHSVFRQSALALLVSAAIWSFFVDDMLGLWTMSHSPSGALSVYGPYDWLEMRWTAILLLATLTSLPYCFWCLRRFANAGLLENEKNWLNLFLVGNAIGVPVVLWFVWFAMIPGYLETADVLESIEGVTAHYDARELFTLASGISWILVVGVIMSFALGLSQLLGVFGADSASFRWRILAIGGGVLVLTIPEVFEGLRVLIALSTMALADGIARTTPVAPLGARRFLVSDFKGIDGTIERIAVLDCSCEGACPSAAHVRLRPGVARPRCAALCLEPSEQDKILELVSRSGLTRLVITGCDGSPVPSRLTESLAESGCLLQGMGWLDIPNASNESWRRQSLMTHFSQFEDIVGK